MAQRYKFSIESKSFPLDISGEPKSGTKNREGVSIKKRGNHLNIKQLPLCGAGGIRTHVQTGKPYAFYMLILAFGFRAATRPGPPIATLSSKTSSGWRGTPQTISDLPAPLDPQIRNNILGAMSRSANLVAE